MSDAPKPVPEPAPASGAAGSPAEGGLASADATKKPRRFLPRFTLRTLTLCVLLAASGLGLWWQREPWTLLAVVPGRTYAFFSPDSRYMVNFNLQEMALQAWDTRTGQLAERWTGPTTDVRFARYSPDGRYVTGWTFGNPYWNADTYTDADKPKFLLWEPGRSEPLAEFAPDQRAKSDAGLEPVALEGGQLIFCPRACALWTVDKKAPRWSLFDAQRTHLLSGIYSEEEMRRDHETAAAEAPKAQTLDALAAVAGGNAKFTVRAAPDASLMLTHIWGASQAAVWNLPEGRKLGALELPAGWERLQRVVFADDGSKVALVCEGSGDTRIYSTRSFEALATLPEPLAKAWAAGFSSRARLFFAVLSNDSPSIRGERVTIWDAETGREVRRCNELYPRNSGIDVYERWICDADFSRVLSWAGPTPLSVLDLETGEVLQELPVPDNHGAQWAAFSPDGCSIGLEMGEEKTALFHRRRPEWWWGLAWLPEFWLTVVFALLLVWSLVRDFKTLRNVKAAA